MGFKGSKILNFNVPVLSQCLFTGATDTWLVEQLASISSPDNPLAMVLHSAMLLLASACEKLSFFCIGARSD